MTTVTRTPMCEVVLSEGRLHLPFLLRHAWFIAHVTADESRRHEIVARSEVRWVPRGRRCWCGSCSVATSPSSFPN